MKGKLATGQMAFNPNDLASLLTLNNATHVELLNVSDSSDVSDSDSVTNRESSRSKYSGTSSIVPAIRSSNKRKLSTSEQICASIDRFTDTVSPKYNCEMSKSSLLAIQNFTLIFKLTMAADKIKVKKKYFVDNPWNAQLYTSIDKDKQFVMICEILGV